MPSVLHSSLSIDSGFFKISSASIIGGVSATGKLSGTATGIAGAIQMGGAAILGTFIIYIGGDESFTLSISVIILLSLIAIISAWKMLKNY